MASTKKRSTVIPTTHHVILQSKCFPIVTTMRHDGLMSSNPVSMLWDGDFVRFSTVKNRMKYKNLVNDPNLTMCISAIDDPLFYIEIRGKAKIEDDIGRVFIDSVAKKYLGVDKYPYDKPGDERVTVTMIPEQISARGISLTNDDQGKPVKVG